MFSGNFAPANWTACDGQLLSIGDNTALFSLIGTTYGGDGQTNFALPDLRGRVAAHQSNALTLGASLGSETVSLTTAQMPSHSHTANAATTATASSPAGHVWGADPGQNVAPYTAAANGRTMATAAIGPAGNGTPHDNMQPFLALTFIIALTGVFPSRD